MGKEQSVEDLIKACFKEMIQSVPFEKITIAELSKKAGISRKSFYTYFEDKQSLLEAIFQDDIVIPISSFMKLFPEAEDKEAGRLLAERMYLGIYANKDFYTHAITQNKAKILTNALQKSLIEMSIDLFRAKDEAYSDEFKYLLRFNAGAHASIIVQWIRDGMVVPPNQLAGWVFDWSQSANAALLDPTL